MSKKSVYGIHQGPYTPNTYLVEKLKARVEVVEDIGGEIGVNTNLMEDDISAYLKYITVIPSDVNTVHTTEAQRLSQERYLTVILLFAAERGRADRHLPQELNNGSLKG